MSHRPFVPLLMVICAFTAQARAADPSELCHSAAQQAASESGVPLQLLQALMLTETGRARGDGGLEPWPWALNRGGKSLWFTTRAEALTYLETALQEGVTNIDIGCFQLNWRWHGDAFASPDAMLQPAANADYAARLVARLHAKTGDWMTAAAAYHSSTPAYAERYMARFGPIYAALGGEEPDAPRAVISPRENRFPLLQAGGGATAGSLVPLAGRGQPLIGGS